MILKRLKLAVFVSSALTLGATSLAAIADPSTDIAERLISTEFTESTLTKQEQMEELMWFVNAAKPFQGMTINVASETIATHEYESQVLARAFSELTGITVVHDLIQEGDVVEKLQTQMQSGRNIYDAYINDSDLIGTHFRYGKVVPVSDMIENEAKNLTLPTLDLQDFMVSTLQQDQTVSCTNYLHSSSLICTGLGLIGLSAKTLKSNLKKFMGMSLAYHLIGRLMKILRTFLPILLRV